MQSKPEPQHQWLRRLIGDWKSEGQADMGPGNPSEPFESVETFRAIGELWVQGEGSMKTPDGSPHTTQMTLGYDPVRKRFVGTWIGSMMSHLWIYDGALDAGGTILTLESEGPSFTDTGKMAKYRDVIEMKSPDHRVLTSRTLRDDGTWHQFMEAHYRRVR
jgi:Protein of unknown function (DUF1579)